MRNAAGHQGQQNQNAEENPLPPLSAAGQRFVELGGQHAADGLRHPGKGLPIKAWHTRHCLFGKQPLVTRLR